MSELEEGGKNIAMLAKLLGPIIAVGSELERIGSLADYEKNLKISVENLRKEAKAVEEGMARARQVLNFEKEEHQENVKKFNDAEEERQQKATKFISAKNAEANEIIATAKKEANGIIEKARNEAGSIVENANNKIKNQRKMIEDNQNQLKILDGQIEQRTAVLANVKNQLKEMI